MHFKIAVFLFLCKKKLEQFPNQAEYGIWKRIFVFSINVIILLNNWLHLTDPIAKCSCYIDEITEYFVCLGKEFNVRAKCVINATGPYTDFIRQKDNPEIKKICQPSSGVHIILPDYYR